MFNGECFKPLGRGKCSEGTQKKRKGMKAVMPCDWSKLYI